MTKFNIFSKTGIEEDIVYPRTQNQKDGTEGFQWFVDNRYICGKGNNHKKVFFTRQKIKEGKNCTFNEYMKPMQSKA